MVFIFVTITKPNVVFVFLGICTVQGEVSCYTGCTWLYMCAAYAQCYDYRNFKILKFYARVKFNQD